METAIDVKCNATTILIVALLNAVTVIAVGGKLVNAQPTKPIAVVILAEKAHRVISNLQVFTIVSKLNLYFIQSKFV